MQADVLDRLEAEFLEIAASAPLESATEVRLHFHGPDDWSGTVDITPTFWTRRLTGEEARRWAERHFRRAVATCIRGWLNFVRQTGYVPIPGDTELGIPESAFVPERIELEIAHP